MKICLALGGGGARGIAHVGVLKAFLNAGIIPDQIVGTSMGSITGAMYAQSGDIDSVERRLQEFTQSTDFQKMSLMTYRRNPDSKTFFGNAARRLEERIIINLSYSFPAIFKSEHFRKALDFLLDDGNLEDFQIKYAAVAGDLLSGEKVVFTSGDVKTAVMASSSIPGFLPPVELDGKLLTDGEVSDVVPCETARELGAKFVVGVNVSQRLLPCPPLENAFDILFRANHIKSHALMERMITAADVVINPDVGRYHWTQFDKVDRIVEEGRIATEAKIGEIRALLRKRKWMFWK